MVDHQRYSNSKYTNAEMTLQNREGIIWSGSMAFIMVLALSLFSVFAWGLQYKLSLYAPSERSKPTMPAAKLLSPKERSIVSIQAHAVDPQSRSSGVEWVPPFKGFLLLSYKTCPDVTLFLTQVAESTFNDPTLYSRPPPLRI